uniref:Uncharacterized protein n=1 Tax=Oryza meridionalis TaxID=40149 RepID=A0A0E0C106_9ORYZ
MYVESVCHSEVTFISMTSDFSNGTNEWNQAKSSQPRRQKVCQVIQWWRWKAHEHHDCHPGVPKDSSVQLQHRVEELFNLLFINHDLLATLHQGPAFAFRSFLQLRNLLGLSIFFSYAENLNLAALEAFFVGKIREFWMARDIFWKFTPRPTKYERNRVPILRMNLVCCKKTIREICHIVLKFLARLV